MFRVVEDQPVVVFSSGFELDGVADISRSTDPRVIVGRSLSGGVIFAAEPALVDGEFRVFPNRLLLEAAAISRTVEGFQVTGYSNPVWVDPAGNPFEMLAPGLLVTQNFIDGSGEASATILYVSSYGDRLRRFFTASLLRHLGIAGAREPFRACQLMGEQAVIFEYTDRGERWICRATLSGGQVIKATPLYRPYQDHSQHVSPAGRPVELRDGWSVMFINRCVDGAWSVGYILLDPEGGVEEIYPSILVGSDHSLVATGVGVTEEGYIELFYNVGFTGASRRVLLAAMVQ